MHGNKDYWKYYKIMINFIKKGKIKKMKYEIKYSKIKNIYIQIKEGKVIIKAPIRTPKKEIERIIKEKTEWIQKSLEKENSKK